MKEKLAMLPGMKENRVNNTIKMDCAKVVDTVDIEDMGDKGVFCRLIIIIISRCFMFIHKGAGNLRSSHTVTAAMLR